MIECKHRTEPTRLFWGCVACKRKLRVWWCGKHGLCLPYDDEKIVDEKACGITACRLCDDREVSDE